MLPSGGGGPTEKGRVKIETGEIRGGFTVHTLQHTKHRIHLVICERKDVATVVVVFLDVDGDLIGLQIKII